MKNNSTILIDTSMKQRMLILFMVFICSGIFQNLFGQNLANYTVSSGSIVYNSIESSGDAIFSWRNTGASTEDDNRSFQVPIGFDFYYIGQRYTMFSVSTNGFIDFSNSTRDGGPGNGTRTYWAFGPYDQDLSSSTRSAPSGDAGTVLAIAPFYYDLTTQGEVDPLGGSIKYLVTGTAPNRVLTVEWIRMAIWTNTTPNFNFQLKLYETSGKIEFLYSTMTQGTFDWAASPTTGYTIGMSGPTISNPPTTGQVLIQQSANSTSFSAAQQNNLQTVPTANTILTFTPNVPTAAPTNLTFTSVTTTGMTLNWTDNASNEIGYVIYRSDDGGVTFNFIRQLAANSNTSAEANLVPGTTYNWRVYALTVGALSNPLSGSRTTTAASQFISNQTGNWNTGSTWVGGSVPSAYSKVIINNGHTVTINTNVQVSDLTVGQGTSGTLIIGNNTTSRAVTISGNLDIQSGAVFRTNSANNSTNTMTIAGNITNAGTLEMFPVASRVCNVTFTKSGSQSISGNGIVTHFNLMTLNMGSSKNNILDVFTTNFSAPNNFLTLTNGTFKLTTAATITPFTASTTIPLSAGLLINNSSAIVNTTGGTLNVNGDLIVTAGTLNIGNAINNHLISNGGKIVFNGGTVNIAGGFIPKDNYTITDLTISNGTVTINTMGSNNTTYAPFSILVSGSKFNQSGGTIVLQQKGTGTGVDSLGYTNYFYSIYTVSGGTLQLGNASTPTSQIMNIKSSIPVNNLRIFDNKVTAVLKDFPLTVYGNVDNTGGILNANGQNMIVGGSWNNTGTFNPTTAMVTFNGSIAQSVSRSGGETFNQFTVSKSGGILSLGSNVAVSDIFALSSGTISVGSNTLTLNGPVSGGGILISGVSGTVNYNKSSNAQNILKANYGNLIFSPFTKTLPSVATDTIGIAGTFTSGLANGHTITGSSVSFNGSGAQTIPVFNFNNLSLATGGIKTFAAGTDTIFGDLKIAAGVTMNDGGASVIAQKNIINSGTHSGTGNITLFAGTASHGISGVGTFGNLIINDVLGATITNDLTVNGQLSLTSGVILGGAYKVIINGNVVQTAGWVNGTIQRAITAGTGSTIVFDIGDATYRTPATITFANVSTPGTVTINSTSGDHPQISGSEIDQTNSVNRYWTISKNAIVFDTCSIVFGWASPSDQDVTGSEALYIIGRYNSSVWDTTRADLKTSSSIRAKGVISFGDFIVGFNGNANAFRTKGAGAGTGNWTSNIWQYYNSQIATWRDTTVYPLATNAGVITIRTGDFVTIPIDIVIDQSIVQSDAKLTVASGNTLTIRDGSSVDLTVSGVLTNEGNDIVVNSGATISFVNGSTYQHAIAGGNVPTASWNATSTCEITGATTTAPGNLNQLFGNFRWNCSSQSAPISLSGAPNIVSGRFNVASTGSSSLQLFSAGGTKSIGGSFSVSGGIVNGISGVATDWSRIIVGDSLIVNGGLLSLSTGTGGVMGIDVAGLVKVSGGILRMSSTAAIDTLWVSKDFIHTAGTIEQTGAGRGRIIFDGTIPQIYTSGGSITTNIDFSVLTGSSLVLGTSVISGTGTFTLQNGATISLGSALGITSSGTNGNIQLSGTRTFGTGANYIYNGVVAQQTGNGLPSTVNTLTILDSVGIVTLSGNVTVTDSLKLIKGEFNIGANTLVLNNVALVNNGSLSSGISGHVSYNRSSDGQEVIPAVYGNLSFSNFKKVLPAAQIKIAGSFTPGTATGHTITGDTINYNGTAQTIAAFTYNNLMTSGSGTKTLGGHSVVNGNLSLLGGSFADGAYTITVKGNIINDVSHIGIGKIYLNGGTTFHSLSGSGTYTNMDLDDANGITTTGNLRVNGVLTLTSGIISLGTDTLIIGTTGTIERAANSLLRHIFGAITKPVPVNAAPQTILFETGDLTKWTPVSVIFNSVTVSGTLTARAIAGEHPNVNGSGIDPLKDVNRYWSLNNRSTIFSTADVILNFDPTDKDAAANTAYFFVKRYLTSAWSTPTVNSRGSTNIRVNGLNQFGDFVVGELTTLFYWSGLAGNHLWTDINNWNLLNIPTIANDVILNGADTIEINTAAVCKNITFGNTSLVVTILSTYSLNVSGNLIMTDGKLNTQNVFPSVTGTTTLSGGTIGYTSTSAQAIPVRSYFGLAVGGGSTKTASGAITTNQNLTIESGTTFHDAGNVITVKGNVANNGVHSGAGGILLNGTIQQQISGVGSFAKLELNNSNGALLQGGISTSILTMTLGTLNTGTDSITITNTRTGSGIIIGKIRRLHTFLPNVSYEFESPNNTLSFDNIGVLPASVTVTVVLDSSTIINSYMNPINRYYSTFQSGGSGYRYKFRMHYQDSEIASPNSEATLQVWRESTPGVWTRLGINSNDAINNWVQWDSASTTGRFSLSSRTITNVVLALASNAVNPVPGDQVTYTISYNNTGDGTATNFIVVAPIPLNTSYVPGSVFINGNPISDGTLGIPLNPSTITVILSTLPGGSSGNIAYKVIIN